MLVQGDERTGRRAPRRFSSGWQESISRKLMFYSRPLNTTLTFHDIRFCISIAKKCRCWQKGNYVQKPNTILRLVFFLIQVYFPFHSNTTEIVSYLFRHESRIGLSNKFRTVVRPGGSAFSVSVKPFNSLGFRSQVERW